MFPLGFVKSVQHFNVALHLAMVKARQNIKEKGLVDTSHRAVRYVDDVLVGSMDVNKQEKALRCVLPALRCMGG